MEKSISIAPWLFEVFVNSLSNLDANLEIFLARTGITDRVLITITVATYPAGTDIEITFDPPVQHVPSTFEPFILSWPAMSKPGFEQKLHWRES